MLKNSFLVLSVLVVFNCYAKNKEMKMRPELLATTETRAWQAYYQKDAPSLIANLRKMFQLQYGLTEEQANVVTADYAKAAAIFGNLPHHSSQLIYDEKVLPLLIKAYSSLNQYYPMPDYKAAAKYDLAWWVERRDPKTANPIIVGESMAKMYRAIYGNANQQYLQRAGYLRALAGQYRDLTKDAWQGTQSQDWNTVQNMLVYAYQALAQANRKNT
ncbi:MAG: hypothetical protein HWD59_03995 [Coxiellaceae bacterium]|nr:MAG: hypothetical protein HWD59_03995 [Coxiellaceae bacterium]